MSIEISGLSMRRVGAENDAKAKVVVAVRVGLHWVDVMWEPVDGNFASSVSPELIKELAGKTGNVQADLALDVSLEKARALHRVWRALNDGDCPKCHRYVPATKVFRGTIPSIERRGIRCPNCRFFVLDEEIERIEKLFAPAMDGAVKIFEECRQNGELECRS